MSWRKCEKYQWLQKVAKRRSPPHFNQSKLTALVCGCGHRFLLDLGAQQAVLQSTIVEKGREEEIQNDNTVQLQRMNDLSSESRPFLAPFSLIPIPHCALSNAKWASPARNRNDLSIESRFEGFFSWYFFTPLWQYRLCSRGHWRRCGHFFASTYLLVCVNKAGDSQPISQLGSLRPGYDLSLWG